MKKFKHTVLLALILGAFPLKAQVYESSTNVFWQGASFDVDTQRVAQDDKWKDGYMSDVRDYWVKDVITLKVIENPEVVFPDSFRCTVNLSIVWWDTNNVVHNEVKQLSVNYNGNEYVTDTLTAYYTFYGGYKDSITITGIDTSGFSGTILPVFRLESSIEVLRDYIPLLCIADLCGASSDSGYVSTKGELLVSWNDLLTTDFPAYDEVDLEWTFYDDSSKVVKNYVLNSINPYTDDNFSNNATRVTINADHYYIPLLYERGYLLWRIRPVRIVSYGRRILGPWSTYDACGAPLGTFIYRVAGHQPNLNWQAAVNYAEEGKRKAVVSYFDGASKNRQSVTKLSTPDIAVVAQTIYDNEGRDVVSVLPSPTISSVIHHFDNFNVNGSGESYTWKDLDSTGGCVSIPKVMSATSGTSLYYSPNNPNHGTAENRYVPDAAGYAFVQKQYTEDLTGRIRRTAGAGDSLKMGAGRETVYYYGKPSDGELKRLFGDESGEASHYFKNLQRDPNGQVSVTYLDMHGRTIATALAGVPLADMDTLLDYRADTIIRDALFDSVSQRIEGLSIIGNNSFTVSTEGLHKFYYTLLPESMEIEACDSAHYCFDCIYDLNITITGDCNNANLPGGVPYVSVDSNYTLAAALEYYFDTTCTNDPAPIIDSFQLTLPVGEYTVTKKLSINPNAIGYYYSYYLRNDTCIKTFGDFYGDALSSIDMSACNMDCDQCRTLLGDSSSFLNNFITKLREDDSLVAITHTDTVNAYGLYAEMKQNCDLLCSDYSICQQKHDLLLYDMTPGEGQYATYSRNDTTGICTVTDSTSIFFTNGTSVYDTTPLYAKSSIVYLNEYGQPDSINVDTDGDGVPDTALLPNQLSVELFIDNWKDSWAKALLPYHPEYCYWLFCDSNESSNSFDSWMLNTNNYDSAVARGMLNPVDMPFSITGFSPTGIHDPFFDAGGLGNGYLSFLQNQLAYYADTLSLWDIAQLYTGCDSIATSCFNCKKDYYWLLFRSVYLGKKQKAVDLVTKAFASSCNVPDFTSGAYQDKTPRFPMYSDSLDNMASQLGVDNSPIDTAHVASQAQDLVDNSPLFTCTSYGPTWWNALQDCGFTTADSALIIGELVAVCELGRDATHPYGASSTPPGIHTARGDYNFDDVLSWATDTFLHTGYVSSDSCSTLLITSPVPYGNTTVYSENVLLNRPDSCVCENINQYYNRYMASPDTVAMTFSGYLQQQNILISEDDIMLLMNSCNDTSCDILKHPVTLPYTFDCNKVCVNCSQLSSAYNAFINIYTINVVNSPNYLTLMPSYLNQQLNMNLTAMEYMNFMRDSCQYAFPVAPVAPCDTVVVADDYYWTDSTGLDTLDVLSNDSGINNGYISIISPGQYGTTLVSYSETYLTYQPNDSTNATDTLVYSVCQYCNGEQFCDTAAVYINSAGDDYMMLSRGGNTSGLRSGHTISANTHAGSIVGGGTNDTLLPNPFTFGFYNGQSGNLPGFGQVSGNRGNDSVSAQSAMNSLHKAFTGNNADSSYVYTPPVPAQQPLANQPDLNAQTNNARSMSLSGRGGFSPSAISWQPTWCDSVAASLANYDTNYVQTNNINISNLEYQFFQDFGIWYSFQEIKETIDSCSLNCPPVIDCSLAQSTLNNFYTTFPEFQQAAPENFLFNYLNARNASGTNFYLGNDDWKTALSCCAITYPQDTSVSYCNQLQEAINGFNNAQGANYAWDFSSTLGSVLGWSHYDSLGNWLNNDLSYWLGQMDSCGISCNILVNCSTLTTAMNSFNGTYPMFAHAAPSNFLTNYLNSRNVAGNNNYINNSDWPAIFSCCGIVFPPDTVVPYCNQLQAAISGYQNMQANNDHYYDLRGALGSVLGWGYNDSLGNWINYDMSHWISEMDTCKISCDSNIVSCSLFAQTLDTFYTLFPQYETYCPSFIITQYLKNSPVGYTNLSSYSDWQALASCCGLSFPADTTASHCDSTALLYLGGLNIENVLQLDSCLPAFVWQILANIDNDQPISLDSIFNQLNSCGYPLPDTCAPLHTFCDTLLVAYNLYEHLQGTNDPPNLSEIVQIFTGQSLSNEQIIGDLVACGSDVICPQLSQYDTLFTGIGCIEPYVWSNVMNLATDMNQSYEWWLNLYSTCGHPLPDFCTDSAGSLCDSLKAIYTMKNQIFSIFEVDDSTGITETLFSLCLGYPVTLEQLDTLVTGCLCGSLPKINSILDTLYSSATCYPEWVIVAVVNARLGLAPNTIGYSQLCATYEACKLEIACPDTCNNAIGTTLCDSLLAAQDLYNRAKAHYSLGADTTLILETIVANMLHYHMSYSDIVTTILTQCSDTGCQAMTVFIHNGIDSLLAAQPQVLHYSQSQFEEILYHYLDTLSGGAHLDWCSIMTNCGDSCPVAHAALLCNRPMFPPSSPTDDSCLAVQEQYAYNEATDQYNQYMHNLYDDFATKYVQKCLNANEDAEHERNNGEFHYTLYYYDQAGDLVKTIPPAGVNLDGSGNHTMATIYGYNTADQVVQQLTPDAGKTETWYDLIGLPKYSRNAKQFTRNQLSYTKYDNLKRTIEVGQYDGISTAFNLYNTLDLYITNSSLFPSLFFPFSFSPTAVKQVTKTFYDEDTLHISNLYNLRNRVASMTYENLDDGDITTYDYGTHFNYDLHGNVSKLRREFHNLNILGRLFVDIDYRYDLISGKVNEVAYQRTQPLESFWHKYVYDYDNRLTDVYTSNDSTYWEHDAHYNYYLHGPLARVVLGHKQVQGIDYAYTLQGWLKTVNSSSLLANTDIGNDGNSTSDITARDEYGFTLGYYTGDYKPIDLGGALNATNMAMADRVNLQTASLFNGNIGSMEVNIGKLNQPLAYRIRYDQLNRIKQVRAFDGLNTATNTWTSGMPLEVYGENYQYDPNGNITTLNRNGSASQVAMDSFSYHYRSGTNKLDYVSDAVSSSNYTVDIDDQSAANYTYDSIGNLVTDVAGCIDSIRWTVYGKVWKVYKCNHDSITFAYWPTGERLLKEVWNNDLQRKEQTYYLRDATGNEMAMYKWINDDTLSLDQQPIYGSSRLGVWERKQPILWLDNSDIQVPDPMTDGISSWLSGHKKYELTNHLGNVLATVSDRKLPHYESGAFDHYNAEVMTATDYYPFGMAQPQRDSTFGNAKYKFGFGGHEKDNEVHGEANWYTFGDYGYDPRIVQRPRTEPLTSKYPYLSPYVSFKDNPVYLNDNNGKEPKSVVTYDPVTGFYKFTKPAVTLLSLVSGVSEERIAAVNIKRSNQVIFSNPDGALTAVDRIQYNNDYFNRADFNFGMDNIASVYNWLDISSHEVRHLPQADKFGNKLAYFSSFLAEYAIEWIKDPGLNKGWDAHNKAPREIDADKGSKIFESFANHVNENFGKNALQNLFLDGKKSDSYKIDKLKTWFNSYKSSGNGGSATSPSQGSGGGSATSPSQGSGGGAGESKPSGGGSSPPVSVHCTYGCK